MRDFYIYGFKSRDDFDLKSARTYDNEKRRCESYLGENMQWTYSGGAKVSFVSADCGKINSNPLFSAWKSKSFTNNDIMLHFYLLEALQNASKSSEELVEEISLKSGKTFDLQTVRGKCNEYTELGIFSKEKLGKTFHYSLSQNIINLDDELLDAVKFFQSGNLGVVGQFILDNEDKQNDLFVFKHHYIAYTLEDGILCDILDAMHAHKKVELKLIGTKSGKPALHKVVPVKIICSYHSGRRYVCAYLPAAKRFSTFRLDTIKSVEYLEIMPDYDEISDALNRNLGKVWGVSFEGSSRNESFSITLHIDEKHERYIINRIEKESRGGALERIAENTYKFTKETFDANEAMPWVKTFIGRIISFESTERLEKKLKSDINRMAEMYGMGGADE